MFTNDDLGTPACYGVEYMNPEMFQFTQYGRQNLNRWVSPVPLYRPVYLYPYQDLYAYWRVKLACQKEVS